MNFQQYDVCTATAPNVCPYTTLANMNCKNSTCSTTDTGFITTKLSSFSSPNFTFLQKYTKRNVKNTCCRLASYLLEFLYVITNHATDAIKAVIHMVNTKLRKLKKNNVRNTNKTRQLKEDI